ncbi:MAG: hypothetical protein WCF18_20490 [Chthoniobacteraceae bacterium]
MANFLTRIELRDSTPEDYTKLDKRMEALGFSRSIRADDQRTHLLPTGNFVGSGDGTTQQVRDLATQAAAETGKAFGILVVECDRAAWIGLTVT